MDNVEEIAETIIESNRLLQVERSFAAAALMAAVAFGVTAGIILAHKYVIKTAVKLVP